MLRDALRRHELRERSTPHERRAWYYDWLMTTGQTAAELRLFGLGNLFRDSYQKLRRRLRTEQIELARRRGLAELGAAAAGLAVTGGSMAWMIWRALGGGVTLGDLALFYQAFNQGQRLMRSLLDQVGQIYYNSLFLGNLFEFLDLQSRIEGRAASRVSVCPRTVKEREGGRTGRSLIPEVRFEGVSFRYPGANVPVLRDFDLVVPARRITAVVGPNGSGKSTLIKLICRLYDPDAGSVRWEGVDLRQLDLDVLRRSITVLFQQPVRYNDTVHDNIGFGDIILIDNQAAAVGEILTDIFIEK
ncbi:MAG: ABC transporter ATP-binding protein, partial [Acidobacteriota bacterium]